MVGGLVGTLLPALGALGPTAADGLSLDGVARMLAAPGFASSLSLTLGTGVGATVVSLGLAFGLAGAAATSALWRRAGRLGVALIASPPAAVAVGLAYLIAPSGVLVRLISPELTGWTTPPAGLPFPRDPWGIALGIGLVIKEVPYLVLMLAAAQAQVPVGRLIQTGASLGYGPAAAWLRLVAPRLYLQVRLPVYAVLAYSLSAVDMALILGPGHPPTLAAFALRWVSDWDLAWQAPGAAAALTQGIVVALCLVGWRLGERVVARLGRAWIGLGRRGGPDAALLVSARVLGALALVAGLVSLALLGLWSIAADWRFPARWPQSLTLDHWARAEVLAPALTTLIIGVAATAAALLLVLMCLEHERRRGRPAGKGATWLLYLPLLVPQIAFLFGVQVILVRLEVDGSLGAVIAVHLVFVLPYVFLSLADPWRALDPRAARAAASLGAGPWRVFARVLLPMLRRAVVTAAAVGFAVSVAQYLPTLFAGAGRVATLATEAVTLASGADRRVMGVTAGLQAALPLTAIALASLLPAARGGQR